MQFAVLMCMLQWYMSLTVNPLQQWLSLSSSNPFHQNVSFTLMYVGCFYFHKNVVWADLVGTLLWCCWLVSRKGIQLVKTEWWGTGVVICLERGADLHMAELMPLLLTVSCFCRMQTGFTFLVPAHPGSPGKGPLNGCVCVCVVGTVRIFLLHLPHGCEWVNVSSGIGSPE